MKKIKQLFHNLFNHDELISKLKEINQDCTIIGRQAIIQFITKNNNDCTLVANKNIHGKYSIKLYTDTSTWKFHSKTTSISEIVAELLND